MSPAIIGFQLDGAAIAGRGRLQIARLLKDNAETIVRFGKVGLRFESASVRSKGCVIVADELVEDEFTAPASIQEQYHYAWSVVACLPAVMGDPDTAATGAVLRSATLRRYALEAGFQGLEILPVNAGMLRFYRLTR